MQRPSNGIRDTINDRKAKVFVAFIAANLLSASAVCAQSDNSQPWLNDEGKFALAIHGGGGVRPRVEMTAELDAACRQALQTALRGGHDVLAGGGNSVSAVEAAIRVMEDSPLFNAGNGASYNAQRIHELDASIMNGATLEAGAVAVVQRVRNPISAARKVMEASPQVLLTATAHSSLPRARGSRSSLHLIFSRNENGTRYRDA